MDDNMQKELKKLNQQANFHIMNRIWISNMRTKGDDRLTWKMFYSLYPLDENSSPFTQDRFATAKKEGSIRLNDDELEKLVSYTGISSQIFEGKERFRISGIGDNDWKDFLNNGSIRNDSYRELENKIYLAIDNEDRLDRNNQQFFNLCRCFYLRAKYTDIKINMVMKLLYETSDLSFKELISSEDKELEYYQHELETNLDMVRTALKYRQYSI